MLLRSPISPHIAPSAAAGGGSRHTFGEAEPSAGGAVPGGWDFNCVCGSTLCVCGSENDALAIQIMNDTMMGS